MKARRRDLLPLAPLLRAYTAGALLTGTELGQLPGLGQRLAAVLGARAGFFNDSFLGSASEAAFQDALLRFYEQCVQPALHVETVLRRAGFVRHALAYLLRAPEPLARKAERCLAADGA